MQINNLQGMVDKGNKETQIPNNYYGDILIFI